MPVVDAGSPPSSPRGLNKEIVQITGDTTINENHRDRLLQVNSSSTVTLTLPRDLPVGTSFEWERYGAGALIFAAASGGTLNGASSYDRAGPRYSRGFCTLTAQDSDHQGQSAVWNLSGSITDTGGVTTSSTAELNFNDGSLAGTAVASKTLVLGSTKNTDTLVIADGGLYLGAGAGTSVSSTADELNLVDGSVVANSAASKAAMLDASKLLQTNANNGTAGTGVTALHYGDGVNVTAVLTVTNRAITVGNSASLGVGVLIYTLPSGACMIRDSYWSMVLSAISTATDTPDSGLGTVIASGAVATLDGTATFENISTGVALTNPNSTPTVSALGPTAGNPLPILTGAAHTVHFNMACAWAANADASGLLNGTVVISYIRQAA